MVFINNDIELKEMFKGLNRKIIAHGGSLMTVECHAEKGVEVPVHSHVHEQCGYIMSGIFEGIIEDKELF